MPDLSDAVLIAVTLQPAEETAEALAEELAFDAADVSVAIAQLRAQGLLEKRRGSLVWGGTDRLRPSNAGAAACQETLRREPLEGDAAAEAQ